MNTQRAEAEPQAVEFVVRAKELELILRRAPVEPDDEPLALPEIDSRKQAITEAVQDALASDETIVF